MAPTARTSRPTIEQLVADARAGIFDDRLDVSVPPELFGPPTEAERKTHAAERVNGARPNGARTKGAPARDRATTKANRR